MLGSIGDLDAMIDAVLKFTRDETLVELWRRTDLTALVASIVDDMADAGLPVAMQPAEPVVLECQSGGLRRALVNLIDNAVKYGTSARVELLTSPAAIRIIVDDAGPGIPDAELQKVFEPFYRLEQSRSRETGGTGLGLAIAQSIVQAHGGQVTLVNRSEGGLRAIVSLPR
jgi:signal transduction histidine kinase